MMKTIALLFALLLPGFAVAGAYEDMEEALISGNTAWAIELLDKGAVAVDRLGAVVIAQFRR
mgnify:CR=1 FL=1